MIRFKFVTHGRLAVEFHEWMQKEHSTLDVKIATSREELSLLINEANAYAGFYELDGIDVSHLKWIHSFGAGVDSFLANKSIVENRIPISRTNGQLGRKIGEYCLANVLNHFKEIENYKSLQKEERWEQLPTRNLFECKVLILGTGGVGSGIANLLKGLVKSMTGLNQSGKMNSQFDHIIGTGEINDDYNIIINTLPETKETTGLLNRRFFENFENALFINVGRGSVVVIDDMIHALNQANLSAAVLDVFENEPLSKKSKLWSHPKITITPHISGITILNDITTSFNVVYDQIKNNEVMPFFVDYSKGY